VNILFIAYKYLQHLLQSKNTKGHGIHSPYLYRFSQNVIYEKNPFYTFPKIETLRRKLKFDNRTVAIKDFGTGKDRVEKVRDVAFKSLSQKKEAQLLFRLMCFLKAKDVLELGTSLGITTSYLASSSPKVRCISLEGSEEIAKIAIENFKTLGLQNVDLIVGNIDDTLQAVLQKMDKPDVVFFDANHNMKATLQYFNQCVEHIEQKTVFIIDDIHRSNDMEDAWNEIKRHPKVTATFDLFQLGIVFFNHNFPKKTYKMRF